MSEASVASTGSFVWSDFLALEEEDRRELVNGRFEDAEMPSKTHERIVALLITLLGHWCFERRAGVVLASGYKLRVDDHRGVMPDVQFYRAGNEPGGEQGGQEEGLESGRPDLVVEVISPSSRSKDSVRKLHDYASLGIPEYWLVDPEARILERLVLRGQVYSIVEALEGEASFRPASFEGLEIPLGRLWKG